MVEDAVPEYVEPQPTCKIEEHRLHELIREEARPERRSRAPSDLHVTVEVVHPAELSRPVVAGTERLAHTLRRPTADRPAGPLAVGSGALPRNLLDGLDATPPAKSSAPSELDPFGEDVPEPEPAFEPLAAPQKLVLSEPSSPMPAAAMFDVNAMDARHRAVELPELSSKIVVDSSLASPVESVPARSRRRELLFGLLLGALVFAALLTAGAVL